MLSFIKIWFNESNTNKINLVKVHTLKKFTLAILFILRITLIWYSYGIWAQSQWYLLAVFVQFACCLVWHLEQPPHWSFNYLPLTLSTSQYELLLIYLFPSTPISIIWVLILRATFWYSTLVSRSTSSVVNFSFSSRGPQTCHVNKKKYP